MAKRKVTSKKNKNYGYVNNNDMEWRKVLLVGGIVLVVLLMFYLLAVMITKKPSINTSSSSEATLQYTEILAGSSFNQQEDEYLVLYYDGTDTNQDISTLISKYNGKAPLYKVDLSSPLNKSIYISDDEANTVATQATELRVKNLTLIKFVNHSIAEYIESYDNIDAYLG